MPETLNEPLDEQLIVDELELKGTPSRDGVSTPEALSRTRDEEVIAALGAEEGSEEELRHLDNAALAELALSALSAEIVDEYRNKEIGHQLSSDEKRRQKAKEDAKPLFEALGWDKKQEDRGKNTE